jgi:hypothetical protein
MSMPKTIDILFYDFYVLTIQILCNDFYDLNHINIIFLDFYA